MGGAFFSSNGNSLPRSIKNSSIINHINMTSDNDASELSQVPSRLLTLFSIAARSAVSSKLAKRTRHIDQVLRKGLNMVELSIDW